VDKVRDDRTKRCGFLRLKPIAAVESRLIGCFGHIMFGQITSIMVQIRVPNRLGQKWENFSSLNAVFHFTGNQLGGKPATYESTHEQNINFCVCDFGTSYYPLIAV